jgi:hypothetical protein
MGLVGGTVAGATVLLFWVVMPTWNSWASMGEELAPKVRELELLCDRAERADSLIARRARLVRELGVLCQWQKAEAEPDSGTDAEGGGDEEAEPVRTPIETEIEKIAKGAGARIKLISVAGVPRVGARMRYFRIVSYQLDVETNTGGLFKMLHGLENGPRFMRLESLRLRHDLSKPDAVGATLQVVAYESTTGA